MAATSRDSGTARTGEQEPLLGNAGDATLPDGKKLYENFVLGKQIQARRLVSRYAFARLKY